MLNVSLFVRVAHTEIETMFFRSTCDTDIIVRDESGLEYFVLPVRICVPVAEVEWGVSLIRHLLVIEFLELWRIHHFDFVYYGFPSERGVDIDQRLSLFGAFGSYDDHAVGTTYTEDSQ